MCFAGNIRRGWRCPFLFAFRFSLFNFCSSHYLPPMLSSIRFSTLKAGLVLFWAVWLAIVTLTNLTEALRALGFLAPDFAWASYNYALVRDTVGAHGGPATGAAILFAGVLVWEALATVLLLRAWNALRRGAPGTAPEVTQAFAVNLALWCAFLVATELFINYATAGTHKTTLIAQIATLILLRAGKSADPAGEG